MSLSATDATTGRSSLAGCFPASRSHSLFRCRYSPALSSLSLVALPTATGYHGGSQRSDIVPAAGRSVGELRSSTAVILTLTTTLTVRLSSAARSRRESVRHPPYGHSRSCPLASVRRRKAPLHTRQRGGSRVSRVKWHGAHSHTSLTGSLCAATSYSLSLFGSSAGGRTRSGSAARLEVKTMSTTSPTRACPTASRLYSCVLGCRVSHGAL